MAELSHKFGVKEQVAERQERGERSFSNGRESQTGARNRAKSLVEFDAI